MENRKPYADTMPSGKQRLPCFSFQGLRFTLKNLTTKSHKNGGKADPTAPTALGLPLQHTFL